LFKYKFVSLIITRIVPGLKIKSELGCGGGGGGVVVSISASYSENSSLLPAGE
jgi:hypothetical protein